ncbi:hypothetical protein [Phreatobacter sp.]|uniref:hypothetical protein n=1 Tax=Phreatobacter sp. TaxID=1966341 RepID=UPI0022C7DD43|nr:hypothetical protein [Phreatobacter sp.]MCZ8315029.1 hypothetical protein [Phreatobacter sp.]
MSEDDTPTRKRSMLLTPVGIGTMALLGTGTFAATNGFGLANRPCTTQHVATSLIQCQALAPGANCAAAFAGGAGAVGLSRIGDNGTWRAQPLREMTGGGYQIVGGLPFQPNTCPARSSSSSSSRSGFYWGGGSSSTSSGSAASQTSVSRGGFGTTASSFSSGGS